MFQYSPNIFLIYPKKRNFVGSKRTPVCSFQDFRKSKIRIADLAATVQCSPPLHNTELQNRCQKRPLCSISLSWKKWYWGRKRPQLQISWSSHTGVVPDPKACLDPYYWPLVNPTVLKKHSNERYWDKVYLQKCL